MPQIKMSAARVNAGYTQMQAAKAMGCSVATIRNWESGKTFPKQPAIEKMCELYGIPYDNLNFNV